MSSALLWQVIRGGTCFTRRGLHGESFSSEAGNLKNKHCYKYSGVSNADAIDVSATEDAIALTVGRPKNANKPVASKKTQIIKKNARKALRSVGKQAASFRPDLKPAAQARAAALAKSLRVKKASKK
uniref:Ribosomal eL28/Mak16 domain-containing protein n=1 Tax=Chlamydomonas euryale TaxID=1486919 RepID=A0A7R9VDV1_9CHLO